LTLFVVGEAFGFVFELENEISSHFN
jgi:hypothetical protein